MQPATPERIPVHSQAYGTVSRFRGTIPGLFLALRSPRRSQPLHSPQCLLESNESRSRRAPRGCRPSQESHLQEEPWVLLVHSPLLQQSRLLAVPPLSDMLKFGGSFHVRQVTDPWGVRLEPALFGLPLIPGCEADATFNTRQATQRSLPSAING